LLIWRFLRAIDSVPIALPIGARVRPLVDSANLTLAVGFRLFCGFASLQTAFCGRWC
jgi:hypothetical protein